MSRSVIAIALGESSGADIERAVSARFPEAEIEWLDRSVLRRAPWRILPKLARKHYSHAVLVAPDLDQQRLELTSLVLALPRAHGRWRLDLRGRAEPFASAAHVQRVLPALVRHLLACLTAFVLAWPLLSLLDVLIRPRAIRMRRPHKLLYLRSLLWLGLEGGGSVAHTSGVIGGLQEAGVDVHVVSSDRLPGVGAPTLVQRPVVWFDGLLREAEELAYNIAFFIAAWRLLKRERPDALYQRHTTFNVVGAVLSRLTRIPLVLEFNSSEVWKGRHWGGVRLLRLAALVERINLRAADRIVVVSEPLRQHVAAYGIDSRRVLVNPNGVDAAHFDPRDRGERVRRQHGLERSIVVGFSGTFGVWHGIPTLAAAIPLVLAHGSDLRFLLIGDGSLRHLVDKPEFRDRVVLTGMVPHAAIPEYLAACDVLLSPHGRQADGGEFFGSPTKLYEYMAAGRAIVASAVGQIADVLEHDRTALLVPPDEPEELAAAIRRLADDPDLRARLGGSAREQALAHHTWRQNAERLLDCFIGVGSSRH